MTEKEYKKFREQYPDAVILERQESETEEKINVQYAAYGTDANTVLSCAERPFFYDFTNKYVEVGQFCKVVFDKQWLDNVVGGLTRNSIRVVFAKAKE